MTDMRTINVSIKNSEAHPHFWKIDVESDFGRAFERRMQAGLRAAIREAIKDVVE